MPATGLVFNHLDVDISAIANQELQTERSVPRGSGEVERCETFLVHLVNVSATLYKLIHHHILPIVAGHMEGGVAIGIGLIDLDSKVNRKCFCQDEVVLLTFTVHNPDIYKVTIRNTSFFI